MKREYPEDLSYNGLYNAQTVLQNDGQVKYGVSNIGQRYNNIDQQSHLDCHVPIATEDWSIAINKATRKFTRNDDPLRMKPWSWTFPFNDMSDSASFSADGKVINLANMPSFMYLCGEDPVSLIELSDSGEAVSVSLPIRVITDLADQLRVSELLPEPLRILEADRTYWAFASQLRILALSQSPTSDIRGDQLIHQLFSRLLVTYYGGVSRERGDGGLDDRRTKRVVDYIENHLTEFLKVSELADVAALSTFHFLRSFKKRFGMTPAKYVTARRMERAQIDIRRGDAIDVVRQRYGISESRYFRKLLLRHFGRSGETCSSEE